MFTAKVIAAGFFAMFAANVLSHVFEKIGMSRATKAAAVTGLAAAAYCVAAGLFLLTDWQDPLATVDPHQVARVSATHGGRSGLIIIAIRFWPYVLMALAGYYAYGCFVILRNTTRKRVHA